GQEARPDPAVTPEPGMSTPTEITEALAALREEIARLSARVAALENGARPKAPAPPSPRAPEPEAPSEEIILAISAPIAPFLGKKPHSRQIRLVGTTAWAQQGRLRIQASHALSVRHARSTP